MRGSGSRDWNHNIPYIVDTGVSRRWLLSQAARQNIHIPHGGLHQLDHHHDTHQDLSKTRPVDGQHGEPAHPDRVRGQLHLQDLHL